MRSVTPGLRRALALLVIAHGLAHAVLPLRGWMDPALLGHDFMPVVLYGVAVMGFTIAGIGLLGVTPFTSAVRPLLVLASGYSLVAIQVFGAGDLWWGAALDVVFLITGLTGIYRRLPSGERHGRWPHRAAVATAASFLFYVACALVLWPIHRAWGSQPSEFALALPGDRPNRNPALDIQHAVTVDAPPEAVWPWLGDAFGVDKGRFVLQPTDDGRTRLIIRTTVGDPGISPWVAAVDMLAFELPHFVMERKMMLQIKALAERQRRPVPSASLIDH